MFKNPYIFKQVNDYLKKRKYSSINNKKVLWEYLKLADKYDSKFKYIRDHFIYFTKGFQGGAKLRNQISKTKNVKEIKEIIQPIEHL